MKKYYLIILLFVSGIRLTAQQIPNKGFEQWQYNSAIQSYEPVGWTTFNFGLDSDTGVYRYQPARTGNYACGLKTNFISGTYAMPGYLTCSFAVNAVPGRMEGYYKGILSMNDTAMIIVSFTKDTNVVADGVFNIFQSRNSYTKFDFPIDWFSADVPDSCTITILGGGFEIDDTLTDIAIDDLNFIYPSGIQNTSRKNADKLQLYPNPVSDFLNIVCKETFYTISLYNVNGQLTGTYQNENILDVSELQNGLYYLQLTDINNRVIASRSFIKN